LAETLLLGSGNAHKVREFRELLAGLPWEVKCLADYPEVPEPVEDGDSFEANAIIKAAYYSEKLGVACVADDSGLVVDALDGAPGIYSSRYAGEECDDEMNNEKLMDELAEALWHERTARFVCCAAFMRPGGEAHIEMGTVEGSISAEPFGENGFGYDPLFVPAGHDRTFAEMNTTEKHNLSHRGEAFKKMRAYLESIA
jgi:XTP/dITP diphosphohydrolase